MINIYDKAKCCGCTACYSVCPKEAIKMKPDGEGFLYPCVDKSKCVSCGLCEKACPSLEAYDNPSAVKTVMYAAQNKNEAERRQSTAGGIFSLIADYVIEKCHGSVFAVGFTDNAVTHKKAVTIDELAEMRGSKYVQSFLGDTFREIKDCIRQGQVCLFAGTPCQVHGLKKFIGESERLITVDLLCLGVSSPKIYAGWIEYLQNKYKDKVRTVYFRDKSYGYATANVRVCFEDKPFIEQKYDAKSYLKTFFLGYNMRPSCYECDFRCVKRAGDFTIGDCHQIGKYDADMDDDKGTTCVWAHTERAENILKSVSENVRIKTIEEGGTNIVGGVKKLKSAPEDREAFFEDAKEGYAHLVSVWAPRNIKDEAANFLKPVINRFPLRTLVFKAIKRRKERHFDKNVKKINSK